MGEWEAVVVDVVDVVVVGVVGVDVVVGECGPLPPAT